MNQKEEPNDELPESKDNSFKPPSTDEKLPADTSPVSAVAQVVEDIFADPANLSEIVFYSENEEELADMAQPVETPDSFSSEPLETGVHQLVNAMVDKPYKTEIDLKKLNIEDSDLATTFEEQSAKLGLMIRRVGSILHIEGRPVANAQGEHTLFLDYSFGEPYIHRKKIILLINPDPKSLWKTLEPDENLPYPKDHLATQQISSEGFQIIAASRRGRSHAHEGKFREDDFAIHVDKTGWHILIVADGAGSATLSRRGSGLACQTALEFLKKSTVELLEPKFAHLISEFSSDNTKNSEKEIKNLLYQALCGAAFAAYKRLEQESNTAGNPLKDYSTTFLLSIVKKFSPGTFVAAFGIGDGAIGVYNEAGNIAQLMNLPDGGEFSGQTRFLTMREVIGDGDEMLRRIKFNLFDKFTFLALMTDGIADPKFGTDNNLASPEKWGEFKRDLSAQVDFDTKNENAAQQLLDYMDFWSPGEHDDRTLAILY
jgi:serine/threonine protein phosphatase PrpC